MLFVVGFVEEDELEESEGEADDDE